MNIYRKALEEVLEQEIKVVTIDTPLEFIHLDKDKKGNWRLTISKSLL